MEDMWTGAEDVGQADDPGRVGPQAPPADDPSGDGSPRRPGSGRADASAEDVTIDPEFARLLPAHSEQEVRELEASILAHGCRDSVVVWGSEGQLIVIEGHARVAICRRNGIRFPIAELDFPDRDEARLWIVRNALARRNLSPYQRTVLALAMADIIARRAKENQSSGGGAVHQKSANPVNTLEEVARIASVSRDTVAKVREIEENGDAETKALLGRGEISVNAAHGEVARKRRRLVALEAEAAALQRARKDELPWKVIADPAVIPCDALIVDPPYGILDEDWEPNDIEAFTRDWAGRWAACGADSILAFSSQRHLFGARRWLDESLAGQYEFNHLLIWTYRNNMKPRLRTSFRYSHEPILFYSRIGSRREVSRAIRVGGDLIDFDCFEASIPQQQRVGADMKQHRAQKPLVVMAWLVAAVTRPGELVVDAFAGSGTTGVAAVGLGRRFVGIEIDADFRAMASRRIAAHGNPVVVEAAMQAASRGRGRKNGDAHAAGRPGAPDTELIVDDDSPTAGDGNGNPNDYEPPPADADLEGGVDSF